MRIIAGSLGGQVFSSPNGHRTHPMSDKVRGALFNSLGDITGLTVLDAYAGSGALSFEAISRGALRAIAIDNDHNAQIIMKANITKLGLRDQITLISASVSSWLNTSITSFDIVIADPPYDMVQPNVLQAVAIRAKAGGIVVFSLPPNMSIIMPSEYELLRHKQYGDAELYFYHRAS
jgi:16S rRNA (guanine966-N2)-methyltransferase